MLVLWLPLVLLLLVLVLDLCVAGCLWQLWALLLLLSLLKPIMFVFADFIVAAY